MNCKTEGLATHRATSYRETEPLPLTAAKAVATRRGSRTPPLVCFLEPGTYVRTYVRPPVSAQPGRKKDVFLSDSTIGLPIDRIQR